MRDPEHLATSRRTYSDSEPYSRTAAHSRSAPHSRRARRRRSENSAVRVSRGVAAIVAVLCLFVSGLGWSMVKGLNSDISSAGGLDVGKNILDGAVDILLVGTDNRTDAQGNQLSESELGMLRTGADEGENTDTILLIRIPQDGSSATAVSIPRDTYVETRTIGKTKINGVYSGTKEQSLKSAAARRSDGAPTPDDINASVQAGRNALINSVKDLTGVEVDHYAEIGLLGFVLLTNAVGGVPVCLNNAVNEPLSGANFRAGEQTVSGSDALSFVRQRHDLPAGDLDRIVRQQVFMAQLVKKILSAGTLADPSKLSKLTDAARRSFVIDQNWDFVDFAMKLKDISGGNVKFETIPVADIDGVGDYGESVVLVDQRRVKAFIAALAQGDKPADGEPETAKPGVDPSTVTVDVVNTTDINGLAAGVSQNLATAGYFPGELSSNPAGAYTSYVAAASAEDPAAQAVAQALGGLPVQADPTVTAGRVKVVLATDYAGPTGSASTGATPTDGAIAPTTYAEMPPSIAQRPVFNAGDGSVPCVN